MSYPPFVQAAIDRRDEIDQELRDESLSAEERMTLEDEREFIKSVTFIWLYSSDPSSLRREPPKRCLTEKTLAGGDHGYRITFNGVQHEPAKGVIEVVRLRNGTFDDECIEVQFENRDPIRVRKLSDVVRHGWLVPREEH